MVTRPFTDEKIRDFERFSMNIDSRSWFEDSTLRIELKLLFARP